MFEFDHHVHKDLASTAEQTLHTISAGGFSATADAFARDESTDGLWFLSMVGSQTALKAIWASLLKQPPDTAHLIRGADGMALAGGYQRCQVPYDTIGTWTTRIAKLPVSGGYHALVYTRTAEFAFERDSFLLLARTQREAPALHHRFLDRRSPPAPPRLLGRLALGQGPGFRGDFPPAVRGGECLQVLAQLGKTEGGPLLRRGVGAAGPSGRGGVPWIGP